MVEEIALEIAVQSVDDVITAFTHGATRVELCQALGTGGLTPSVGLIRGAVAAAKLNGAATNGGVHVLIRPRPGGFVYSQHELDTVIVDIADAIAAGADGVVIGALDRQKSINRTFLDDAVTAAAGREVTFHRAFDVVVDRISSMDVLVDAGVTRVLTSGGEPTALQGIDALRELTVYANGRIHVMVGGGVTIQDVPELCRLPVDAIHLSARRSSGAIDPSGPGGGGTGFEVTDAETVRRVAKLIEAADCSVHDVA